MTQALIILSLFLLQSFLLFAIFYARGEYKNGFVYDLKSWDQLSSEMKESFHITKTLINVDKEIRLHGKIWLSIIRVLMFLFAITFIYTWHKIGNSVFSFFN